MASPTFLGDGNTPRRSDAQWAIQQKILGALVDGAGGSGGSGNLSGTGSPEGSVTANPGRLYVDTATTPPSIWAKATGTGTNTGWVIEIEGV